MRIYLPARAADLAADSIAARAAHAVTPALRSAYPGESEEDLEVPAFLAAADTSLALLTATDAPVRVVIAADVGAAEPARGEDPTEVSAPEVPWSAVVSIHVDDPDDGEAAALVRAAVGGDEEASEAAGELDLLWFDVTERELLRRLLA
ncbi:DUF6912 family protein [Pseudactinotalea suaedae]|jgi:hypothetical protein|uniref:DUF6912 family protein n=1 Tax=Pseudactinotalea suaedae TaxID=1524924 RepID=UPI0012E1CAFA|nr:hypothetical protein [Pseudactinotalea suaedae]